MENDTDNALLGCFGLVAAALIVLTATTILNGLVLVKLWTWFIVPTLGLAPLTLAPALGIGMVVGFLTHQYVPDNKNDGRTQNERWIDAMAHTFIYPLISLGVGYIIHLFI